MKSRIVLFLAILLCITAILFGIFSSTDSGKPNPEKLTTKNNILYYFGDNSTIWENNSTGNSEDKMLRFQNVTRDADPDLEKYYYPHGSLLGVGYSGDEIVVLIHKDQQVNETLIREIYSVVERHGERQGIKMIPCKFLSIGLMKSGPPRLVPYLSLRPLQGLDH